MIRVLAGALACFLAGWAGVQSTDARGDGAPPAPLRLGNFSVSLTVKDLEASRAFYEKLGFTQVGGDAAQRWLVMGNDSARIGLFQGMFERNMLTFNPGWDRNARKLDDFDDVRDIQRELRKRGLEPTVAADETGEGTAFLMLADPDGNPILLDQHVPRPGKPASERASK